MTDDLQRLAREFPERFFVDYTTKKLVGMIPKEDGTTLYVSCGAEHWTDQALLHAALVELVEESGLKLCEHPSGDWEVWSQATELLSRKRVVNYAVTDLAAVLAAAPEIKRRLEVTT